MIITAIKRLALISAFTGVTLAGVTALATDHQKANELASVEVKRAKTALELEQAEAVATMTALDLESAQEVQQTAMQAEKEAVRHELELNRMTTLAPFWTASQVVFIALGTGGACFVVYAGVASYRKRSEPLVTIRNVPITRDIANNHTAMLTLISQEQALSANVRMAQANASQAVPAHYAPSVTYAPHTRQSNVTNQPDQTTPQQPDHAPRVPTFSQLMKSGAIGPGQTGIIYGFTSEQKVYQIDFAKLTSMIIFGNSGSGKTTTLASVIGQLALNGFQLFISDPHFGHDESLSARLTPLGIDQTTIAHKADSIESQARTMLDLLEKAKTNGQDVRAAWIIDEVTAVFRLKCAGIVQIALEAIAQEGRKYKLVAYAASQATRSSRFGDSSVRDSFPIIALHRLRRSALRNVGLTSSDEFAQIERLARGVFLLDDGLNEPELLTAPLIERSDLLTISGTCQPVFSVPDEKLVKEGGNQAGTEKNHTKKEDSQAYESLHKNKSNGLTEEPKAEEPKADHLHRGFSDLVPDDLMALTDKEAKAVLLAKETDMKASAIYGQTGGNKKKILKLVRETRSL